MDSLNSRACFLWLVLGILYESILIYATLPTPIGNVENRQPIRRSRRHQRGNKKHED